MSTRRKKVVSPPAMPPRTAKEEAQSRELVRQLERLSAELRQRNLTNAVYLAQQAVAGYGPLVDHFAELGRRYAHLLEAPPKPSLRVIEGGNAHHQSLDRPTVAVTG